MSGPVDEPERSSHVIVSTNADAQVVKPVSPAQESDAFTATSIRRTKLLNTDLAA